MRRRNVGTKTRGRKKFVPGVGKSLPVVRVKREQDGATSIVSDPTATRKVESGLGKLKTACHVQRSCCGGCQPVGKKGFLGFRVKIEPKLYSCEPARLKSPTRY